MTWIDITIASAFLVFSVLGLVRGLVAEVFGLLAWVLAIYIGAHYGDLAAPLLGSWIAEPRLQRLAGCLLVGVAAFTIVAVLGALLNRSLSASVFAPVNRMLGLLFGAARGAIVIGLLTLLALQFGLEESPVWQASKLRTAATTSAQLLDGLIDFDALLRSETLLGRPTLTT
jgi:membrane protein required for colicin V production